MNKMLVFAIAVVIIVFAILFLLNKGQDGQQFADINASPSQSVTFQPTQPTGPSTTPLPSIEPISATQATISTDKGDIVIELYPQDAPKTVTNFATLSKMGFYNGLTFHRVEDWVVQGGDPTGTGAGGKSIYGSTFEDELNPDTTSYKTGYVEGVVAMANAGPNTNSSQFFILTKDYPLQHNYTIFGKVTSGMDVVKKITKGDKMNKITVE